MFLASFLFIFGLIKQTVQILPQIILKKCPSSIWHWDLNSQPTDYKSPPLTTKGSRPNIIKGLLAIGKVLKGCKVPHQIAPDDRMIRHYCC